MRRTGMSFQRTRMSAERTLMSVIRTALSLIGFGFTIFQVFTKARESGLLKIGTAAPSTFGLALVALGVAMLLVGIVYHVNFMRGLRSERSRMSHDRTASTAKAAIPCRTRCSPRWRCWSSGLYAIVSMVFDVAKA